MTLDSDFNFYGLIKKCCVLLDLDEPTTWEDTEETEYKKLKVTINSINRSIILSEYERWKFRDVEENVTLDEGVNSYTSPNGMIKSMNVVGEKPLIPEYAWNYLDSTVTGLPTKYFIQGDNILVYPTPTADDDGKILKVQICTNDCARYESRSTILYKANMEDETDFSLIPTQFSDVIIYGACRDYKELPDRPRYQHYNSRFTQEIRQMRKSMMRSLEIEPYNDTGGGRSNEDTGWIDFFFNEAWK